MSSKFPVEYFEVRFEVPERDLHLGWPAEFVILTAYATTGQTWLPEQNAAADGDLAAWCDASGLRRRRITGYSISTGHAEPGWAVELDFSTACRLGVHFRQHACYLVQADQLWIIACADPARRSYVGSFRAFLRQRPQRGPADGAVE